MADNVYDAIVVGSGISGGWAAKELTEKGLKVLMLERGEDIKHISGYTSANKNPWEFPHRGGKTQEMIKATRVRHALFFFEVIGEFVVAWLRAQLVDDVASVVS